MQVHFPLRLMGSPEAAWEPIQKATGAFLVLLFSDMRILRVAPVVQPSLENLG